MGVKGRMWCVVKEVSRSAVLFNGEKSSMFTGGKVWCRVAPVLFYV